VTADAGVPGLMVHDMRRGAARDLRSAGVAEGAIMHIGGWKTLAVFERYAIVNNKDRCDAVLKLANQRKFNELQRAENRSNTAHAERSQSATRTMTCLTLRARSSAVRAVNS
jgi:hypothetical protein